MFYLFVGQGDYFCQNAVFTCHSGVDFNSTKLGPRKSDPPVGVVWYKVKAEVVLMLNRSRARTFWPRAPATNTQASASIYFEMKALDLEISFFHGALLLNGSCEASMAR